MKKELIDSLVRVAIEVLQKEAKVKTLQIGNLVVQKSSKTLEEITTLCAITGDICGVMLYGMKKETAMRIASCMLEDQVSELDDLSKSAIAELGNTITGNISMLLEKEGFNCSISPPTLIIGEKTQISTIDIERICIPLITNVGKVEIEIALKQNS